MIVFLIDADNLSSPDWVDEACKRLEAEEGSITVRRAYGSADNLRGLSEVMHAWTIRPFLNLALSKNTTDVALAVDAMELACLTPPVDCFQVSALSLTREGGGEVREVHTFPLEAAGP